MEQIILKLQSPQEFINRSWRVKGGCAMVESMDHTQSAHVRTASLPLKAV